MENFAISIIIVSLLCILQNYNNNIIILLSLELSFLGISVLFLSFSLYLDDFSGILTTLFILCLSACESAIGLTLLYLNKKDF